MSLPRCLPSGHWPAMGMTMNHDIQTTIAAVIGRAPDWIRRDLSHDGGERVAAEEALAAMIAAALTHASPGEG